MQSAGINLFTYYGPVIGLMAASFFALLVPGIFMSFFCRKFGELQPANPLTRLASVLIDGFVMGQMVLIPCLFLPLKAVQTGAPVALAGYLCLSWLSWGKTPGQSLCGLGIYNNKNPKKPIGAFQSFLRLVLLNFLPLSFITLPFSKKGALLHDLVPFTWVASGRVQMEKTHWLCGLTTAVLWVTFITAMITFGWASRPGPGLLPLAGLPDTAGSRPIDIDGDKINDALAIDKDKNQVIELLLLDSDGDGRTDSARVDLDQDRFGDYIAYDKNGDGTADIFDIDGDGVADTVDINGDGEPDQALYAYNGKTSRKASNIAFLIMAFLILVRLALDIIPHKSQNFAPTATPLSRSNMETWFICFMGFGTFCHSRIFLAFAKRQPRFDYLVHTADDQQSFYLDLYFTFPGPARNIIYNNLHRLEDKHQ